jgi:general secretion pathway protein D
VPQNAPERFGYTTGIFKLNFLKATDFIVIARQFLTDPTLAKPMDDYNTAVISAPAPEVEAVRNLLLSLDVPFFEGKYVLLYTPRHLSADALKALLDKYTSLLGSTAKGVQRQIESATLPNQNRLVIVAHDRAVKQLIEEFIRYTDSARANRRQIFQYPLTSQKAAEIAPSIKKLADTIFGTETPVEVVADKASNSLFIVTEPEKFAELSKLLRRMDYRPPAVYIDVTLIEVTLNDRLRYGVEWFLTRAGNDVLADAALDLSVGITSGLDIGLVSLTSNKFLALELLKSETDLTILSNPHLIVRNGSTARINIGQEIAIASATLQTDTAGSSTQTTFTRRDVSISFEVTPDIRLDGTILLSFKLTDERDAGLDTNDPPQPVFNKREVVTDLVTHDGETIFIGGIMQRSQQTSVSKIPILGDLPYLGAFFSDQDDRELRTELVIFLTTRLILDGIGTALVNRAVLSLSESLGNRPPVLAEAEAPRAPEAPPVGGTGR